MATSYEGKDDRHRLYIRHRMESGNLGLGEGPTPPRLGDKFEAGTGPLWWDCPM